MVACFLGGTTKSAVYSILGTKMTISKLLLGVVLSLSVAACTTVEGPSDKAISVSFKNQAGSSYLAGYNPVPVRAAVGQKSVPAIYQITSANYESPSFQSPAKVNLPAYSSGAQKITLSCTYEEETKAITVSPENLSAKARAGSAIGVALLCPICGVGVAAAGAAKNKDNDIYGFVQLDLSFDD
jgi:hypothetical protein